MIIEGNMTVLEVSKELYKTLYRWISEYEEYRESVFLGDGTTLYFYKYEK